jgi:hypothetical protein
MIGVSWVYLVQYLHVISVNEGDMRNEYSRQCSRGVTGGAVCLRQGIAQKMSVGNADGSHAVEMKVVREYRMARKESQTRFWSRFGVTQSRGDRYEMGMAIPPPIAILLVLYFSGVISDDDLSSMGKPPAGNLRVCGKCWQSA